ncbi:MAG: CDP-diacylglycerol--glycerol-3-phosphate 3-phosphatidyltransferase [Alkaliphilus sp.]|nr:MAG: CDP-diacylglycerol--glycerol-3-phosphate 3-phosphatidyltransferase [Alkaliphilus sp.]
MNVPNMITMLRIGLVPLFIIAFFFSGQNAITYSVYIFIFAGITDIADGYIARKYNLITKFGQVMDPLADKLMQVAVIGCFTLKKLLPPWVLIIVVVKELFMIIGSFFLYRKKDKVIIPANKYGKISTIIFYFAIIFVAYDFNYAMTLVFLAIVSAIVALLMYIKLGVKEMKKSKAA